MTDQDVSFEEYKIQRNAEAKKALEIFLMNHPGYKDNAWTYLEAEEIFNFQNFSYGVALVIRKSDRKRGSLDFTNQFGPRIYFDFR
jgi:hypothetical protein